MLKLPILCKQLLVLVLTDLCSTILSLLLSTNASAHDNWAGGRTATVLLFGLQMSQNIFNISKTISEGIPYELVLHWSRSVALEIFVWVSAWCWKRRRVISSKCGGTSL